MLTPLFTSKIDETVIQLLGTQTYATTSLLEIIIKKTGISKQAFYDALRRLRRAEIIIVHKKIVSLNILWIEKLVSFTREVTHTYNESYRMESRYLTLKPGERVSYRFHSLEVTDQFWGHAGLLLAKQMDKHIPITFYNPHQWFLLARRENELAYLKSLSKYSPLILMAIGSKTKADSNIQKTMKPLEPKIKYSLVPKPLYPRNHFINVYGDIILEVTCEERIARAIDEWFIQPTTIEDLLTIIQQKSNVKLVISNNPRKATDIRKKIAKHFHIPKELTV